MEDTSPIFSIGQHESKRVAEVSMTLVEQAQICGYNFVTSPITTPHFHTRVQALISEHMSNVSGVGQYFPIIAPLEPVDTPLAPRPDAASLVAFASPWTDLCSPDPLIANLSQQILALEIAYAAFCGIGYVVLPSPILHHGPLHQDRLTQYGRAVAEALDTSSFTSLVISMPLMELPNGFDNPDSGHLGLFARDANGFSFETSPSQPIRTDSMGSWDSWNVIRSLCRHSSRLYVALMMTRTLPSEPVLKRWISEPLRLLMYYPKTFQKNNSGFPVLQRTHQGLLSRYIRLRLSPWILLCDVGPIPTEESESSSNGHIAANGTSSVLSPAASYMEESQANVPTTSKSKFRDPTPHLSYLRHLQRNQPSVSTIERFSAGYQDYLQAPLQPLADNLESITYEIFEKDPIKYDWYERAVHAALTDWTEFERAASGPEGRVVIAVVGAGRGPLVARALRAADNAGVPIELWAVEKNPNAYVVLSNRNKKEWDHRVSIVKSDMRAWPGPHRNPSQDVQEADLATPSPLHKRQQPSTTSLGHPHKRLATTGYYGQVDILISELLGSFGDNELSPECLDGISHVLSPQGISIPCSYTSHLTPISAPKLHTEVLSRTAGDPEAPFVPYVVMFQAIDFLSTKPMDPTVPVIEQMWEFKHPAPSSVLRDAALRRAGGMTGGGGGLRGGDGANEHNSRFSRVKFLCLHRGVINGLAGYFETVLYDGSAAGERNKGRVFENIELSTNPNSMDTKSKNMISWFPIFFPLKDPLYIPDNSEVVVNLWRQTDDRKVWYEWMIETFVILGKHNHRIRVGGSDLHSSRKHGCLM
ncbi:MAG: methyltransferase protein [Vezdaea aestivalis]|nr:MAG: methyltransferase protein [Vezdaea aestivalis]